MLDLIGFLLIGLLAGWIANRFMRGRSMGLLSNLLVGVVGAFVGGLLFRLIGLAAVGLIGKIIMATLGAVVLLYLVQTLKKT